jgi:tetratricopeptide (TPR) repeat protein
MQKLISISQKELTLTTSEDHYIIDNILENSLDSEVSALFLQANACLEDEDFSKSIQFYNSILNIDSKNISALIDKGTTLQILGRIKSSIRCFDKALDISPNNIDALINKGSALHLDEKYLDAIVCYETALKIDEKCSMALAYKGLSLGELGNLAEAINYFKKALSVDRYCTIAEISKETAQNLLDSSDPETKKL